jgi:hypothetical protein
MIKEGTLCLWDILSETMTKKWSLKTSIYIQKLRFYGKRSKNSTCKTVGQKEWLAF